MRVNRGGTGGGSSDQGDGSGGMRAPGTGSGSGGTQGPRTSGAMREPTGGASEQRKGADDPGSRTDRGNQNDEGIGSSASRGGGGGEGNPHATGTRDIDGG